MSSSFSQTSRYSGRATTTLKMPDGRVVAYLERRFLPPTDGFAVLGQHTVTEGERMDTIASRYLGDPLQFWRICDANAAMQPEALTETPGTVLLITLPQGISGAPYA